MQEYCEWIITTSPDTTTPAATRARSYPVEPSIEWLMDAYSINEDNGVEWSVVSCDFQIVEQEFQAYIMNSQSKQLDILQYWKVSLHKYSICLFIWMLLLSYIKKTSLLYSPWQ